MIRTALAIATLLVLALSVLLIHDGGITVLWDCLVGPRVPGVVWCPWP